MDFLENYKTELAKAHLTYTNTKMSKSEANARLKIEGESEFPILIFPQFIQETIIELFDNANYNIDYISASILTALAGIIGNSFHLRKHIEWIENPTLWMVIVGKNGQNKSAAIKTAFRSMKNQQIKYDQEYKAAI